MASQSYFLSFLLTLAALHATHAVEYTVTNNAATTPGGIRFNNDLGVDYTKQQLAASTEFIWRLFQQNTPADRRDVPRISLFIDDMDGIAYATNSEIHISASWIAGQPADVLKREFNWVLYHENTHNWQWNGQGNAPGWLIEGIADFVSLRAGYVPVNFAAPGQGESWTEGYSVTARFLDYCNSNRNGIVAELNKRMKDGYSDNFFVELMGKTIQQLWSDYKAQYAN